jgi:diguanylate cyclase (GGDEF)-like protein/PAS domain S-box-containing protein
VGGVVAGSASRATRAAGPALGARSVDELAAPSAALDLALAVSGLASWNWSSRTDALTWSAGLPGLLGVSREPAPEIERHLRELLGPVLVAARAEPWNVEWELQQSWRMPRRAERRLRIHAKSLGDLAGDTRLVGVVNDTADRRSDAPADDVSTRYRLLVELSPDGIVLHQDGRIVYANPACARMVGVDDPDRMVGDLMMDYVAPKDRAALSARVAAMQETETYSEQSDMTLLGRQGELVDVSSRSVRTNWQGRPGFQAILRDLTASRAADATLRFQASLLEQVSDAIISTDLHHRITSWNPGAEALFGWTEEEVLTSDLQALLEGLSERSASRSHLVLRRRDGSQLEVRATVSELKTVGGEPSGLVIVCSDESSRRQAERDRRASDERYATVVSALEEGVLVLDAEGVVETANPAAARLLGVSDSGLIGRPLQAAVALFNEQGERLAADEYPGRRARVSGLSDQRVSLAVGKPAGLGCTWITVGASPLPLTADATATSFPVVLSFSDITQARSAATKLFQEARLDDLTGLPNRTLVLEHLDALLERNASDRTGADNLAVLFIDLDRFKVVNDSLGHEAGDEVLRAVGARLRAVVRRQDLVGRLSGDEFVVVTPWTDEHQLRGLAGRIANTIEQPITTQGRQVVVRSSIGIASTAESPSVSTELLRDADVAMYRAKQDGRNRCVVFDAQLRRRAVERLELEADLRQGLAEQQLWVAYQPILRVDGLRLVGAEALARWNHPGRGEVPPGVFIPVAEDAGQIDEVFAQVLSKACAQAALWRQEGSGSALGVSVNLSARQLSDTQLVSKVTRALERVGLSPSGLTLELTESALMEDADAASIALAAIKDIGVHLSIDDFGTGYSSLSYLRRFPADFLKIDRSFIVGICDDPEDRAIVAGVLQLARALDRRVVAEGVETAGQLEMLADLGCDYVQGYYLSLPLTPAAFSKFATPPPLLLPGPRMTKESHLGPVR